MIEVYVALILNEKRTLESVPKKLQEKVKKRLSEYGYTPDGSKEVNG